MNTDTLLDGAPVLPGSIVLALRQLIRRARHLIIIRGVCASCAAGIGAFLVIMGIDAGFTLLARWPRWVMTVMAYSAWAGALAWFLIRPLARSFTLTGIARLIEAHHPELQERLSSVVELLSSRDVPAIRGSDVLIGALTEEAVRDVAVLRPKHEISFRGAIPFAVAAGIVIVLLAGLWLIHPRQTRFLLARAAAPFLNLPNVHAADLVVEPGDTLIASGSRLRISVRTASPAATSARLRQRDRQGRETVTEMVAVPSSTNAPGREFAVTLPDVVSGFQYRLHAGDALTRYYTVRVAIPPIVQHLDVRCRYPEYSRLGVKQERDGSGTIRALAGSEVTVSAQVNKAVPSAVMRITTSSATNTIKGILRNDAQGVLYDFSLTLPPRLNGSWTLVLTDEIGLGNAPFEYAIQAIPDNPPVTAVLNLRQREFRLGREDRLPVAYSAEDDLGLAGLDMLFTVSGLSNEVARPLPLPAQAGPQVRAMQGETQITMSDPLFAGVPRVAFRLRATDNLPAALKGPQSGYSETFTIILDERAPSWKEQVLTSQEDRAQQGLKQVQQKLASARDQARALETPLAQQPTLTPDAARKVDSLQDALASADNTLRNIAADVDKGFFEALATNLTALADNHVRKAENLAGQIRLVDRPAERTALHSNVTAEIDTSLHAVERAIQDHDIARAAVRRAVELDRLADKQTALAQTRQAAERATPPPTSNSVAVAQAAAASNEWQRAQDQVADRLAAIMRETPGAAQHVAAATSNLIARTAAQAAELAERQTALAALTRQQTDRLQTQDRDWRALAGKQEQLATLARRDPLSTFQSEPMQQAAAAITNDKVPQAIQTQMDVANALRKESERRLQASALEPAPDAARQDDPKQVAAEALQTSETGLKAAQAAAAHAAQAAGQAQKRADNEAVLAKKAEGARKPDIARELAAQAAESRQAAKEAKPWSQAADQAADQAKRMAAEVRRAAEQAARPNQPESARQEAARQAARAAEQVEQFAEDARAADLQATARSVARGSPQERAVRAEERAIDAVRDARQSALKADASAARARQEAGQAEKRADLAVANNAPPPQVQDARDKAANARAQAEATAKAAAQSQNEAGQAHQEALATQQATDKALRAESPKARQENAEAAEAASQAAQEAASRAAQQARLADEATQPQGSPPERAARAAQLAAKQAAQAEQAAAAARKAAQAMAKPVAEARQLAEQAWQTGQNDLAQSTGQKLKETREQAERVEALADATQKMAAEARQAATEAASTPGTSAERQAQQAELAARAAEAKADQARKLAEQAKATAESKPEKSPAASQAQQAAQQAQEASQIAQQAAQAAQQSAQRAGETAQQTEQQAAQQGEAAAKQAAEQVRRAAQQTQQAAQQAQQAAQAAQQTAQQAQQAVQQTRQAAASAAPEAAQKASMAAEQATAAAFAKAQEAVNEAVKANTSAEWARDRLEALKLSSLAAQQDELRRQATELLAEKERAGNTLRAELSEQLGRQMSALAANRPLDSLQQQQERLSREADALAHAAQVIRAQTDQGGARTPATPQTAQAAREMTQAAQSADQAAQQLQQVAGQAEPSGKPSSPSPTLQQAAERTRQAQQDAAQNLKQAAQNLQNAARSMGAPAAAPAATRPIPASPEVPEAVAGAYQAARQAAESHAAADASQTAVQLAQAADKAADEAQALGANARPRTMQTAMSGGGGQTDDAQASDDVPSFARRLGLKLQDWMRLHGELKDDVLQASGSDGPEEYRPIIKRYFNEVSGHGGEEP